MGLNLTSPSRALRSETKFLAIALALGVTPNAAIAAGVQPVVFLSTAGSNAEGCGPREAPCRTLQYALDNVVQPGGAIYLLSSGNFGPATISFSISITGDSAAPAGVNVFGRSATGITIAAAATDKITLQGLTIDGGTTGARGVTIQSAESVLLRNCMIRNFDMTAGIGLNVRAATPMTVTVEDTMLLNAGLEGAHLEANGANTLTASVTRVEMIGSGASETGNVKGSFKESLLDLKINSGAAAEVDKSYVTVDNNGIAAFSNSNVRVSGSGQNYSFGDNVAPEGTLTSTKLTYK